jgi:hypothetical protein
MTRPLPRKPRARTYVGPEISRCTHGACTLRMSCGRFLQYLLEVRECSQEARSYMAPITTGEGCDLYVRVDGGRGRSRGKG